MKTALNLAALGLPFMLAGCAVGGSDEAPAAGSLLEVEIPADFTFATSRGLTVRAAGDAQVVASTLAEVRLAGGELIHRGPLTSPVELAIPTAATALEVTLRSAQGERTVQVPVRGAEAVVTVE